MQRGEFLLDYQPILDLRTGALSRFEALLRWRHPTLGKLLPRAFIGLVEDLGLILPIGRWVLEQACRDAAAWPGGIGVAVNLSASQLGTDDIMQAVTDALAQSQLPASRLELEITETVRLAEGAAELGRLRALRQLGVRIALDDFGTGYSSLSYLRGFPFDTLKIDRSFVSDLPGDEEAAAIVRAITGLGRSLGIAVCAEGVEAPQQLDLLRLQGCSLAQGYLIGLPMPAGEALHLAAGGARQGAGMSSDGRSPRRPMPGGSGATAGPAGVAVADPRNA